MKGTMPARHRLPLAASLVLLATGAGCDDLTDRFRGDTVTVTDTVAGAVTMAGTGLALGLQAPGGLRPGEEGVLRLSITNQSDTIASRVQAEMFVPDWVEPMPPRFGDRSVTMTAVEGGATRFSYSLEESPLQAGELQTIEQRVRIPAAGVRGADTGTGTVRARLIGAEGQVLAEVSSEIAVGATAPRDTATVPAPADTAARPD
jgi:hypothetical protein